MSAPATTKEQTMAATIDLTGIRTTAATRRIVDMLAEAGLDPQFTLSGPKPYRGAVTIVFDESGANGTFGAMEIGAHSGRILRTTIYYGNDSDAQRLKGYRETHPKVSSLAYLAQGRRAV